RADPVVLVASTGEVYGACAEQRPRRETDPVVPSSPYAASKAGAELAALEAWRRAGLRVVVARAFAHTGPGQDARFVVPAFGVRPLTEADPDLVRGGDILHLVGDATKLRAATGWAPRYSLDDTLREVVHAQAD